MIDDKAAEHIRLAVESELAAITARYGGGYNSAHEGSSVLREEIEEAKDAMADVDDSFGKLWKAVRKDGLLPSEIEDVLDAAVETIGELTQVAAVCKRLQMGVKNEA